MKKLILTIALTLSLFSSEYKVDNDYSSIKFEASKMLFIGVDGEFSKFSGTIKLDEYNKITQINGLISIDSIYTNNKERDDHLKANDYFHILDFPNIVFSSTTIIDDTVNATVSIKGIKKELNFKLSDLSISDKNVTFKLTSTVDRQQFMLNGSMSAIIADNVDVIANIVAEKYY